MSNAREVPHSESRVPWVDFAKTWSIALVVVMHATVDVGLQIGGTGWLHSVVAFAKPFRMPNFFLVSGLFLGRIVDRPWREFLDKRVLHFVYFYALWLFIELLTKAVHLGIANPPALLATYFWSFVEPFSSMWFIQVLPFFYVAARLVRRLPVPFVLVAAVALHILAAAYPSGSVYALYATMTPSTIVNSFCMFFVYFLAGHLYRDRLFAFAKWATARPAAIAAALLVWALAEEMAVRLGWQDRSGVTLLLGFAGGLAVIALSTLVARARALRPLAYCGRHSLVVYLAFYAPMAATRLLLARTGLVTDVGLASIVVTTVAVAFPLALEALTRDTPLAFLFARPGWARIAPSPMLQPGGLAAAGQPR